MAYLELLGSPRARVGEGWVDIPAEKPPLLLLYLACRGNWLDRSELAHMVRPDADEKTARHNLRLLLHRARKLPWAEGLEVEQTRIRWCVQTDVRQFREAMAQLDWAKAVALHKADLLSGMNLIDMPEMQAWTELERETLLAAWREAVINHAADLEDAGVYLRAAAVLKKALQRDPLAEDVLQAYLRAAYLDGQREQALAAFEAFKEELDRELELEPLEPTLNLIEAIRQAKPLGPELEPSGTITGIRHAVHFNNLPSQPTAFIGREAELSDVTAKLAEPVCRLLTLIGPGGIGKTRLALTAAAQQLTRFAHGVCLVPLAPLGSADPLVPAVAEALRLSFYGREDPKTQLLNYLREKELLLLMDNFEHLLDRVDLVAGILQNAPDVTVLATSRERLNLQGEWLFPVGGLSVPELDNAGDIGAFSAVKLFVQSAQRVQPGFSLSEDERPHVVRICRSVAGTPLGIELAASWVRAATCQEIAGEIEDNLDFLQTSLKNIPERHRSMRAVFDYSWGLLSEEEREVFGKLSVFRGGFTADAAKGVAGAGLPALAGLVDKSFLRLNLGRYGVHELLRQYAGEKLAETPHQQEAAEEAHGRYFAALLSRQGEALYGKLQREALGVLGKDIENLRTAWRHAVGHRQEALVASCLEGLQRFYTMRSWNQEGLETFQAALQQFRGGGRHEHAPATADSLLLGRLLLNIGHFNIGLGRYGAAREQLAESLEILSLHDAKTDVARALRYLGHVARWQVNYVEANELLRKSAELLRGTSDQHGYTQSLVDLGINAQHLGNLSEATALFGEALVISDKLEDAWLAADLLTGRGNVEKALGHYHEAERLYDQSLAIKRELGHQFGVAACLINLGVIAEKTGEYEEAHRYYREGYAGFWEIGYRRGMALSLHNQATISHLLERQADARHLFEESLSVYRDIGGRQGITAGLRGLGLVALAQDEPDEALGRFRESLELSREIGYRQGVALALHGLGEASTVLDHHAEAKRHFLEALEVATESKLSPVMLECLLGIAEVMSRTAELEQAMELISLTLDHPASEMSTRDKAERLLAGLKAQTSSRLVAAALARGKAQTLEEAAAALLP